MKKLLTFATCLVALACNLRAADQPQPIRWAVASKQEIETTIFKWTQAKAEEATKDEASPEIEEKIRAYQSLQMEFTMKYMHLRSIPMRPVFGAPPKPEPKDPEYDAMAKRVADAKAPIAAILDKRNNVMTKFRDQYSVEKLVSEYSKGRFDLVVDAGYRGTRDTVLFHTNGEVLDITLAVIDLFEKKVASANEKSSKH
ncbi:MAG: hypothetical protein JWO95_1310 [Verrucomicrobiales bacterium]|nr:hypothetical protein [Verrucomicrobiales bacterium]